MPHKPRKKKTDKQLATKGKVRLKKAKDISGNKLRIMFYKGTGCKDGMANKVIRAIEGAFDIFPIHVTCWTNDPDLKDLVLDYAMPSRWNVVNKRVGKWDIAISHSAGGFPLTKTTANFKIAINPAYTKWGTTRIIRSRGDWLVPEKVQKKDMGDYHFWQNGGHGSLDAKLLRDIIATRFQPKEFKKGAKNVGRRR